MVDKDDIGEGDEVYSIAGLIPADNKYSFSITLDGEFGDALKEIEAPQKQQAIREHITEGILDHDMTDIRFHGDTLLLSNITVYFDATGLDCTGKGIDKYKFHTHNVDTAGEATEIIASFVKWIELATRSAVLELDKEDENA